MYKIYIFITTILLTGCTTHFVPVEDQMNRNEISRIDTNEYEMFDKKIEENTEVEQGHSTNLNIEVQETVTTIVDGQEVISSPENTETIVNKTKTLSSDYSPTELAIPNIPFIFEEIIEKRYLRMEAIEPVEQLFAAALEENIELLAVSGYRSFERQEVIYQYQVELLGIEEASKLVALPGQSEHQLGLALDVTSQSAELKLTEEFGETIEGKWLKDHAHKYGFIIRYPLGKEDLTGYSYEPWHIRYVGREIAEYLYVNDLVLEQLFSEEQ